MSKELDFMSETVQTLVSDDLICPGPLWVSHTWTNADKQLFYRRSRTFDGTNWTEYVVDIETPPVAQSATTTLAVPVSSTILAGAEDIDLEIEVSESADFTSPALQVNSENSQANWYFWNGASFEEMPSPLPAMSQHPVFGWAGYLWTSALAGRRYYVRSRKTEGDWHGRVIRCRSTRGTQVPILFTGDRLGDGVNASSFELEISRHADFSGSAIYKVGDFGNHGSWGYFDGSAFQELTTTLATTYQTPTGCVAMYFTGGARTLTYYSRLRYWNGTAWSSYSGYKFQY